MGAASTPCRKETVDQASLQLGNPLVPASRVLGLGYKHMPPHSAFGSRSFSILFLGAEKPTRQHFGNGLTNTAIRPGLNSPLPKTSFPHRPLTRSTASEPSPMRWGFLYTGERLVVLAPTTTTKCVTPSSQKQGNLNSQNRIRRQGV